MPIQFGQHQEINNNMDTFQSTYVQYNSTETAMVRIQGDLLRSVDRKKVVDVVLLNIGAAFDNVDNSSLISQLRSICIHSIALQLLESYMSNIIQTF